MFGITPRDLGRQVLLTLAASIIVAALARSSPELRALMRPE